MLDCRLNGKLRNVGPGPAFGLFLEVRVNGVSGHARSGELTPLLAGERRAGVGPIVLWPSDQFVGTNIYFGHSIERDWVIVIEYNDVFGNTFHTIHHKNPQLPWTVCGKGPAPSQHAPQIAGN